MINAWKSSCRRPLAMMLMTIIANLHICIQGSLAQVPGICAPVPTYGSSAAFDSHSHSAGTVPSSSLTDRQKAELFQYLGQHGYQDSSVGIQPGPQGMPVSQMQQQEPFNRYSQSKLVTSSMPTVHSNGVHQSSALPIHSPSNRDNGMYPMTVPLPSPHMAHILLPHRFVWQPPTIL